MQHPSSALYFIRNTWYDIKIDYRLLSHISDTKSVKVVRISKRLSQIEGKVFTD